MASIQCPHCGAKLNVPEAVFGKSGRCPKCQQKFVVQPPKPPDELSLVPLGDDYSLQPLPPAAKLVSGSADLPGEE